MMVRPPYDPYLAWQRGWSLHAYPDACPVHTRCIPCCSDQVYVKGISGRNRFGSIRFGSEFSKFHRFGSVRFGNWNFQVPRGSARVFRTRRGSVRFGSIRFRARFRPVPKLDGSARFGRFGSVSYSFLLYSYIVLYAVHMCIYIYIYMFLFICVYIVCVYAYTW